MLRALMRRHLLCLLAASFVAHGARAQQTMPFVWGFPSITTTNLPECSKVQLFVQPNTALQSQPPFTLIAYEASGIPTVNTLGSDQNSLTWTVDHSPGSQLVLSMVDARGNSGGVSQNVYTVTQGQTNSCHQANPSSSISITTNTSKTLSTCDVLPLKISGGVKPYTLAVAILNSVTVLNVSMGRYDEYDWINRAPPGIQLLASVSDSTGTYGASTVLLTTTGSTDISCPGRQSTLRDSSGKLDPTQTGTAPGAKTTSTNHSKSSRSSKAPIIAGIAGGVVLVAVLVAGFLFFLRKRGRGKQAHQYYEPPSLAGGGGGSGGGRYDLGGAHGGAPGGGYTGVPVAEEVAPFVMGATPYRDYPPTQQQLHNAAPAASYGQGPGPASQHGSYNQYSHSSYASQPDSLASPPVQPADQHGRYVAAPPVPYNLPPGAAAAVTSPTSPSTVYSVATTAAQQQQQQQQQYPQYQQQYQQYQPQQPQQLRPYSPTADSAYGGYANVPHGTVSAPSASGYSTGSTGAAMSAVGGAVPRPGAGQQGPRPDSLVSRTASASASQSAAGGQPVAGASSSSSGASGLLAGGGLLAVANPGFGELEEEDGDGDVKSGPVPPATQAGPSRVIQHEDVEDVVEELPPAYKERTGV